MEISESCSEDDSDSLFSSGAESRSNDWAPRNANMKDENKRVTAAYPDTGEDSITSSSRRVSRALPWIGRGGIEDAARDYAAARRVDVADFVRRVRTSAARAALLVADDLTAAVTAVRRSEGDLSGVTGATLADGNRLAEDLLGFWVSEGALAVRRRLGLL